MPDIPELTRENALIATLIGVLEQGGNKPGLSYESIVDDWKKSFQDNEQVNTLILEADPEQLQIALGHESALLDAFLAALDGSPAPGSPVAEQLRERWYDLFTREKERNQEILNLI